MRNVLFYGTLTKTCLLNSYRSFKVKKCIKGITKGKSTLQEIDINN